MKWIYAVCFMFLSYTAFGVETGHATKIKAGDGIGVTPTHGIGVVTVKISSPVAQLSVTAITWADGTVQRSSPPAGGSSGAGKDEISLPVIAFLPAGTTNAAYISYDQYQVNGATVAAMYGKFPLTQDVTKVSPNRLQAECIIPKGWGGGAAKAYALFTTTQSVVQSNYWFWLYVSTAQFSAGSYTVLDASYTSVAAAYEEGIVELTYTLATTPWVAGQKAYIGIERRYNDGKIPLPCFCGLTIVED